MTLRRDENGRAVGLDWGAISPPEGTVAVLEERRPAPAPKRRRKASSKPRLTGLPGGKGGPAPVYDIEEIRRLYESGLSCAEVAAKIGASKPTVSRRVRMLGIARTEMQSKGGGPAPKERCIRNHEFTPENTRHLKGGGRSCKECERIRGRKSHKVGEAS